MLDSYDAEWNAFIGNEILADELSLLECLEIPEIRLAYQLELEDELRQYLANLPPELASTESLMGSIELFEYRLQEHPWFKWWADAENPNQFFTLLYFEDEVCVL
jgi:hypothetical protein